MLEGLAFTREIGEAAGLPVLCACANERLAKKIKPDGATEVFPIGMYMRQSYLDKKV